MRLSALRRARGVGALVLALLQLGAAAALPSADAALDAERVGLPVHVESPHNENCPSAHDHLFCQVVRSLAAVTLPDAGGALLPLPIPTVSDASEGGRFDAHTRPDRGGPTAPRPPPLG